MLQVIFDFFVVISTLHILPGADAYIGSAVRLFECFFNKSLTAYKKMILVMYDFSKFKYYEKPIGIIGAK